MVDVRHVGAGLLVLLLVTSSAFLVPPGSGEDLRPVPFDQTLATGLTGVDVQQARSEGFVVPRAEVFYAQYEYVVGYYGVDALTNGLAEATAEGYFGQPLAVFVTDFSGTGPHLSEEGFVEVDSSTALGWTRASEALFVVDSGARTPGGPEALPFSAAADARAFAEESGGEVVDWETVRARFGERRTNPADRLDEFRQRQTAWADEVVAATDPLRDREVSTVVGEDAPTLAAALEAAPPGTTVELPPGTYDGNLTVEKPVTIRGAGPETVVAGDGTGSVLTVRSPEVAITSLRMDGVGNQTTGNVAEMGDGGWDERIRLVYGQGDAAIRLADARRSLVADVEIDTPANGVVALNSSRTAVRNVTVRGPTDQQGSMGALAMYSRMVVEQSTFSGGKDGVYTHYSDGLVIRNNEMSDVRFGVHQMYTSDALVANNTIRGALVGTVVMTRPAGNAIVGNDIRESEQGISLAGGASFATENVLADNRIGLAIGSDRSYYARNTIVRNEIGIRSETLLPTNDVVANDVVANERYVSTGSGVQNVWAVGDRGNYWGTIPGLDRDGDGVIDRPFRPASPLDGTADRSAGAATLARSPAVDAIRAFQSQVPGLRESSVIDPAPLAAPVRPDRLAALDVSTEDTR